jgi:hypothetical protein
MAFVTGSGGSAGNAAATIDITNVNNAWGVAVDDILVLLGWAWKAGGGAGAIASTGFTAWATEVHAGAETVGALLGKRAVSADVNGSGTVTYTVTSSSASEIYAAMAAWRGRLAAGDPQDALSDTAYVTKNTTVRAASMTIATADSDVIWGGWTVSSATPALAPPTGMTSRVSRDMSAYWTSLELADLAAQATGATGDKDGTVDTSCSGKHAFMVALKPAVASTYSMPSVMRTRFIPSLGG